MTPEREAEIRAVLNGDQSVGMDDALIVMSKAADDLLAHVDHLTAKHERARADWKTTIKFRTTQRNEERAKNARLRAGIEHLEITAQYGQRLAAESRNRDMEYAYRQVEQTCHALLNPTEGEDHERR